MTDTSSCHYDALVALSALDRTDALCVAYLAELARWFPGTPIALYGYVEHHDYWRVLGRWSAERQEATLRQETLRDLDAVERDQRQALGRKFASLLETLERSATSIRAFADGYAQGFRLDGQTSMVAVVERATRDDIPNEYLTALGRLFRHQYVKIDAGLHDTLTGLLGRVTFEEDVGRVIQRVTGGSTHGAWGLALMDIDHFKSINDRFGHLFGDEVLVRLAQTMRRAFREDDRLFRYGGEEFAVLLHAPDRQDLRATLERFREAVAGMDFPQLDQVTISIGYVTIDGGVHHVSALVDCADKALYYAKDHGRNQVCGYQALVDQGLVEPVTVAGSSIDLF